MWYKQAIVVIEVRTSRFVVFDNELPKKEFRNVMVFTIKIL